MILQADHLPHCFAQIKGFSAHYFSVLDSNATVSTWHELKGSTSFPFPVQNLCRAICLSKICVERPYYRFSSFAETYQSDLLPFPDHQESFDNQHRKANDSCIWLSGENKHCRTNNHHYHPGNDSMSAPNRLIHTAYDHSENPI